MSKTIDLSKKILNKSGEPIKFTFETRDDVDSEVILGTIGLAFEVCLSQKNGIQEPNDIVIRYDLMKRIMENSSNTKMLFTDEETVLLSNLVMAKYDIYAAGQIIKELI